MSYEIKKGVPIPTEYKKNGGRPAKYPFDKMEIGDCIEEKKPTFIGQASKRYGRKNAVKFITRTVGDMVRVWRIE